MTHTVLQSPSMTPEEFARSDATHVRVVDDDGSFGYEARILEHKTNDDGEFPVQFADGGFGGVSLAAVGANVELFRPLAEAPAALWFIRSHDNDRFYFGPPLPEGLKLGPYTEKERDGKLADPDSGANWAEHTWIKYVPVES